MATGKTPVYIDITTQAGSIGISRDNVNWNWVFKRDLSVFQLYNPNTNYPANYRYKTATVIILKDGANKEKLHVELQDIPNRATWNLGTQAALTQASSDIATWIATP